jgi:hypothetical protein
LQQFNDLKMRKTLLCGLSALVLSSCAQAELNPGSDLDTLDALPKMRWSHVPSHADWNIAAVEALNTFGQPLVETVPADIDRWCPGYKDADRSEREAFWVGFMSALAKHESTYRQTAVSSNGKWFGLLQISPATARGYDCEAGSGEELKDGGQNLSCAIRIMSVTVPRDGVIADKDGRWRGVAADWGPLRVESKRKDIAAWLKQQPFCKRDT